MPNKNYIKTKKQLETFIKSIDRLNETEQTAGLINIHKTYLTYKNKNTTDANNIIQLCYQLSTLVQAQTIDQKQMCLQIQQDYYERCPESEKISVLAEMEKKSPTLSDPILSNTSSVSNQELLNQLALMEFTSQQNRSRKIINKEDLINKLSSIQHHDSTIRDWTQLKNNAISFIHQRKSACCETEEHLAEMIEDIAFVINIFGHYIDYCSEHQIEYPLIETSQSISAFFKLYTTYYDKTSADPLLKKTLKEAVDDVQMNALKLLQYKTYTLFEQSNQITANQKKAVTSKKNIIEHQCTFHVDALLSHYQEVIQSVKSQENQFELLKQQDYMAKGPVLTPLTAPILFDTIVYSLNQYCIELFNIEDRTFPCTEFFIDPFSENIPLIPHMLNDNMMLSQEKRTLLYQEIEMFYQRKNNYLSTIIHTPEGRTALAEQQFIRTVRLDNYKFFLLEQDLITIEDIDAYHRQPVEYKTPLLDALVKNQLNQLQIIPPAVLETAPLDEPNATEEDIKTTTNPLKSIKKTPKKKINTQDTLEQASDFIIKTTADYTTYSVQFQTYLSKKEYQEALAYTNLWKETHLQEIRDPELRKKITFDLGLNQIEAFTQLDAFDQAHQLLDYMKAETLVSVDYYPACFYKQQEIINCSRIALYKKQQQNLDKISGLYEQAMDLATKSNTLCFQAIYEILSPEICDTLFNFIFKQQLRLCPIHPYEQKFFYKCYAYWITETLKQTRQQLEHKMRQGYESYAKNMTIDIGPERDSIHLIENILNYLITHAQQFNQSQLITLYEQKMNVFFSLWMTTYEHMYKQTLQETLSQLITLADTPEQKIHYQALLRGSQQQNAVESVFVNAFNDYHYHIIHRLLHLAPSHLKDDLKMNAKPFSTIDLELFCEQLKRYIDLLELYEAVLLWKNYCTKNNERFDCGKISEDLKSSQDPLLEELMNNYRPLILGCHYAYATATRENNRDECAFILKAWINIETTYTQALKHMIDVYKIQSFLDEKTPKSFPPEALKQHTEQIKKLNQTLKIIKPESQSAEIIPMTVQPYEVLNDSGLPQRYQMGLNSLKTQKHVWLTLYLLSSSNDQPYVPASKIQKTKQTIVLTFGLLWLLERLKNDGLKNIQRETIPSLLNIYKTIISVCESQLKKKCDEPSLNALKNQQKEDFKAYPATLTPG